MEGKKFDSFRAHLFKVFRKDDEVLGSWLGDAYRNFFDRKIKDDFTSGVGSFVAQNFSDLLELEGKRGMDVVFRFRGGSKSGSSWEKPKDDGFLWSVFNNPRVGGGVAIRSSDGELLVSCKEEQPPDGFEALVLMSSEDHFQLVERYCRQERDIDFENVEGIRNTNGTPASDFWRHWTNYVNENSLMVSWGFYRIEQSYQFFTDHLKEIGISEERVDDLLKILQTQREFLRKKKTTIIPYSVGRGDQELKRTHAFPTSQAGTHNIPSTADIRQLVGQALGRMSEGEIRSLRLPLGVIYDLLTRRS